MAQMWGSVELLYVRTSFKKIAPGLQCYLVARHSSVDSTSKALTINYLER